MILTKQQLTKIRQNVSRVSTVDYIKSDINTAIQSIEDWFELNKLKIVSSMPVKFTDKQKRQILKQWLNYKFNNQ